MNVRTGIRITRKFNQILDEINNDPTLPPKCKKELFQSYYDEYLNFIHP